MTDFKEGDLAKVKISHHKVAPKGSIVKVRRSFTGRMNGSYWGPRQRLVTFEPLVQRGSRKVYTWPEGKFEKL